MASCSVKDGTLKTISVKYSNIIVSKDVGKLSSDV